MILSYGDLALDVARRMARAERRHRVTDVMLPAGHWERVRREVARQSRKAPQPSADPVQT